MQRPWDRKMFGEVEYVNMAGMEWMRRDDSRNEIGEEPWGLDQIRFYLPW